MKYVQECVSSLSSACPPPVHQGEGDSSNNQRLKTKRSPAFLLILLLSNADKPLRTTGLVVSSKTQNLRLAKYLG